MSGIAQGSETPYRDVYVTAQNHQHAVQQTCPICGTPPSSPRATFCSHRCQMIAFRRRLGHQQRSRELSPQSLTRPSRDHVVYACPECETRYLGVQRCCECNLFCKRLGPGGHCPGCSDIITIGELLEL